MSALLEALRVLYMCVYQIILLVAIPLAFDVGGEDCGMSFTLVLVVFYAALSTLRIALRSTRLHALGSTLYYLSIVILPSLLLVHLDVYPKIKGNPLFHTIVEPWKLLLNYSTGAFAVMEGFCTLIVIQSYSRVSKALARHSDVVTILQLVVASLAITLDLYLLLRMYTMPAVVGLVSATLIGVSITACVTLGLYGIITKRSSVTEMSMLLTYIVYVIYLTFTDFQSTEVPKSLFPFSESVQTAAFTRQSLFDFLGLKASSFPSLGTLANTPLAGHVAAASSSGTGTMRHIIRQDLPILPQNIIDNYSTFMSMLTELTPTALRTLAQYTQAAVSAITPSVVISLVVRLSAFFLAMRIIPYIRHPRHQRLTWRRNPVMFLMYAYSPCLVIAVYAHLLLQHFGGIVHVAATSSAAPPFWHALRLSNIWVSSRQAWQFWGWVNVFTTLCVYGLELLQGSSDF